MERQFQRSELASSLPQQRTALLSEISHGLVSQGSFYVLCCFTYLQAMNQPCIFTQSLQFFPCALQYCFLPQLGTYCFALAIKGISTGPSLSVRAKRKFSPSALQQDIQVVVSSVQQSSFMRNLEVCQCCKSN